MIRLAIITATLALATAAHADPCTAPVSGYKPGQVVSGSVIYVGDGDSLCLALGRDPSQWLEIRESDFNAPEINTREGRAAKVTMDRLIGRRAVCTVQRGRNGRVTSFDRVIAACRVDGVPIGVRMRATGISEGGR